MKEDLKMKTNKYPTCYTIMKINESDEDFGDVSIFVATECYIVRYDIKFDEFGNTDIAADVVYMWNKENDSCIPEFVNGKCINKEMTTYLFDNKEDAILAADEANKKSIYEKIMEMPLEKVKAIKDKIPVILEKYKSKALDHLNEEELNIIDIKNYLKTKKKA